MHSIGHLHDKQKCNDDKIVTSLYDIDENFLATKIKYNTI